MPISITNLTQLAFLDISHNLLVSSLPFDLGRLINLRELLLYNNSVSGQIPLSIQSLTYLTSISVGHNRISGEIPPLPGCFPSLTDLDLSDNSLSGTLPNSLLVYHVYAYKFHRLDISDNNLKVHTLDVWPRVTNKYEYCCDSGYQFQPCSAHSNVIHYLTIVLPILFSLITALFSLVYLKLSKQAKQTTIKNGDLFSIWNFDGNIAFKDIINATEDSDIKYCIGTGAYGSLYKMQ